MSNTRLSFTFKMNRSDSTFGWNGEISGMRKIFYFISGRVWTIRRRSTVDHLCFGQWKFCLSVYYSQYLDRQITIDNSLLLTSDLTPIVALVNEKRSYLGDKYSNCTPDKGSTIFLVHRGHCPVKRSLKSSQYSQWVSRYAWLFEWLSHRYLWSWNVRKRIGQ